MVTYQQVEKFTERKLQQLLAPSNPAAQKASLARLRRGVGRAPGELPELWGELLPRLPEKLQGQSGPSAAEWAVYTALTLFALHQQGKDPEKEPMHVPGQALGTAVARLTEGEPDREAALKRVLSRFNRAATAQDMDRLAYHLRGLVQMLRAKGIPVDYARLAVDLYRYQNPVTRGQVRLRWGQDLYGRYDHMERETLGEEGTHE